MTTLAGIILIGGFALLMLLRVPVSFAMLLSTLASALVMDTNLSVMIRQMMDGANNFSLLSIPFFIVMGEFMGAGGISEKIVGLANLVVGRFRGGLAYVNVLDSMFFGGISGSAVADVSSLGSMVIPMMKKQGYDEDFAVGLTVTTACQGVLIPPSHNMVIYALAAGGVSIGTLFIAGLLPGILLPIIFAVGTEKGRAGYYVVLFGGMILATVSEELTRLTGYVPEAMAGIVLILLPAAVYVLSWRIAIRLYKQRNL